PGRRRHRGRVRGLPAAAPDRRGARGARRGGRVDRRGVAGGVVIGGAGGRHGVVSDYLLGADVGTSALKTALVQHERGVVAVAERAYPMYRPHPGWAENDPEDW